MNKNMLMTGILMLVIGIGAFAGGMKYQQSKIPAMGQFGQGNPFNGRNPMIGDRNNENQAGGTQGGVGQRRMGNGQIVGEIMSVDEKSITVKMTDGSSKIVLLSDKTGISKSAEVQRTELKVGVKVAVFGTPNSDGSVSGQNIELDPAFLGQMVNLTVTPVKTN